MFGFVGETLRRLRKERGKTLEQLGEEAGLGRGQLSRIENARQEATLTTLEKILTSQGVSRRDFFHRYDLVEGEAAAVERAAGSVQEGQPGAVPRDSRDPGTWPEEIRDVLGKLESFVNMTFHQPHPIAQGAVELGDLVILFRVVPKSSSETAAPARPAAAPAPDRGAAGAAMPPSPRGRGARKKKH